MEHTGQGAEEQTPQEFQQRWGAPERSHNAAEADNHRPSPPPDATGRQFAPRSQPSGPVLSGLDKPQQPGRYDAETMLSTLAGMSRALAHVESIDDILPLALRTLLTLAGGESGLALTYPGSLDLCRVAIRHNIAEELVKACTAQSTLLKTACGEVVSLSPTLLQESSIGEVTNTPLGACLARAGVRWYLALPLLALGQVEAVLVVLGQQEPVFPPGNSVPLPAVTLLGELASDALEEAQLRHLLARERHARDEFIGLASHELKSPLTIIKGYAQLLLRQAKRSDGGMVDVNGLEAISQQVNRMSVLVGQLLDVSRIERGMVQVQPQQTDLVALTQRVVEQRQKTLADMPLHLLSREPELIALVDPARVEQVLSYLLDNAIKFGQEQGPVEVTLERAPASVVPGPPQADSAEPDAEHRAHVTNEVALISVRDYGLGVPVEERSRLFKAFYRGPENSNQRSLAGLGLGLYLGHDLVTRQGGHLWAEFPDAEGLGGSLFRMSFPLIPPS